VQCILLAAGSRGAAAAGAGAENADLSIAHDGERLQPLYALLKRTLNDSLEQHLRRGRHKVEDWMREQRVAIADFSDIPQGFCNLNTIEDLRALESPDIEVRPDPGR